MAIEKDQHLATRMPGTQIFGRGSATAFLMLDPPDFGKSLLRFDHAPIPGCIVSNDHFKLQAE
ncbi:MAG: hypothetical protein U0941_16715 [Planctomycetaceae bacterium]